MTYDLFHQLLYLSSNQDDSSEFLEKLEHMTATDVAQAYASLQISSRNPFPASGMTHSAAMASEILIGKTILEALNTDLVCDAINTAMRELFLQIVYGRSQTAFSEGGLPIGAGLEDLGKGLTSQVGTMYATKVKGPRYLQLTEGYVTRLALDEEDQIIGYEFVKTGPMMENIKKGMDANEAVKKATGSYGRFADAAKYIDPRHE